MIELLFAFLVIFFFFYSLSLNIPSVYATITSPNTVSFINREKDYDQFGYSVASAGDVNGDGFPDIIIGATLNETDGGHNDGAAYIFYGASDFSSSLNASSADVIIRGEFDSIQLFGNSVSGAGDVNNDGYDDVIIGSAVYPYPTYIGRAYIFYGGPTLSSRRVDEADIILTGENAGDWFAWNVSSAGDMNNDGYDDVLIAASSFNSSYGRTYVFSGNIIKDDADGEVSAVDADLILSGTNQFGGFGDAIAKLGDINNDGFDDIAVGAPLAPFGTFVGRGYVFLGEPAFTDKSDNDADVIFTGSEGTGFAKRLTGNCDINNDGFNDLLFSNSHISNSTGKVFVFFGSSSLENKLGSEADIVLAGESTYDNFGDNVVCGKDLNNDGIDDILVSSRYDGYPDYGNDKGRAYVFFGGSSLISKNASEANVIIDGENAGDRFSYSETQNGQYYLEDINNDGFNEWISAAYRYDRLGSSQGSGKVYIYNLSYSSPSISINNTTYTNDTTPIITGLVTDSVAFGGVDISVDSGSWTSCSAADGSFDSTSESFNCTLSELAIGNHSVRVRTYDTNNVYIPSTLYSSDSFIIETTPPVDSTSGYPFSQISPSGYTKVNTKPTLSFKKASDATSGISSYKVELDTGKNKSWSTDGIPASGNGSSSYTWKDDANVKVEFVNENDSDSSNDEIRVYFKGLDNSALTQGKHTWKVIAYDNAGNTLEKSTDFYIDTTSPSVSDLAIADVAIIEEGNHYELDPNQASQRTPSFSGKAIDTYQGSEKENSNNTKDTFDKIASGPDKITLTLKKLKSDQNPNSDNPVYENYLSHEYSLSDIQDIPSDRKEASFYITSPQPIEDGYYQVNLDIKDQAGNSYSYPAFYISLNYQSTSPSSSLTSGLGGLFSSEKKLKTEITETKEVSAETEEETKQVEKLGYEVQVKVVDKDQNPVKGAKVELHSDPKTAYTNDQGIANFINVEKGDHTVKIAYDGYTGEEKIRLEGDNTKRFEITVKTEKENPVIKYIIFGFLGSLLTAVILFLFRKIQKK